MALTVAQHEEIVTLLRDVPGLVDELEARHATLYEDVLAWLHRAERVLESNRLAACSQIAALRAQLIEAGRGVHHSGLQIVGRPSAGKLKEATASFVIGRADSVIQEAIAARRNLLDEAQRIAQQLVAVAYAKRLPGTGPGAANSDPHTLRDAIATDGDLGGGYTHLVGLVGSADALLLIDRARPLVG